MNGALFSVFGVSVTAHALAVAASVLVCLFFSARALRRAGKPFGLFVVLAPVLCLLFSHLGYCAVNLYAVMERPAMLYDFTGGYMLYGAGIGWLIAVKCICGKEFIQTAGLLAPAAALMIALARFCEGLAGMGYSFDLENEALGFFPLAVYDADYEVWFIALFVFEGLYALALAYRLYQKRRDGDGLAVLLFFYAMAQAWFESMRRDDYMRFGFVRANQLFSVLIAGGVLLYWLIAARRGAPYVVTRFAAYIACLGVIMLMEFQVEYKVAFLTRLYENWNLTQTGHKLCCYGVLMLATVGALCLGARARKHARSAEAQRG